MIRITINVTPTGDTAVTVELDEVDGEHLPPNVVSDIVRAVRGNGGGVVYDNVGPTYTTPADTAGAQR
jgi:hypothetical protein